MSWLPVVYEYWWTVALDGLTVGGTSISVSTSYAAIDSGTGYITGPTVRSPP